MHQSFLIIDAFLQGDHGLGPGHSFYIIDLIDDILCMAGILRSDLAEQVEFTSCDMSNGHKGYLTDSFQYELCLRGLLQEDTNICNK